MNFRFPGVDCRNTGPSLEGCFPSPLRQLRTYFTGPEHPSEQQKCPLTLEFFNYSRDVSTMAVPAKAVWPKAEAKSTRISCERSTECLGIWLVDVARSSMGRSTQIIGWSWQPAQDAPGRCCNKWNWKGCRWQKKGRAFSKTQSLRWPFHSPSAQQSYGELSRTARARGPEQGVSQPWCHKGEAETHTPWDRPVSLGWDNVRPKLPPSAHNHRLSVSLDLHWGLRASRKLVQDVMEVLKFLYFPLKMNTWCCLLECR